MFEGKIVQRQILAQAVARPSGFVLPLPASLEGSNVAVAELLEEMIQRQYIVERPTLAHEAFWLDDNEAAATVLVITGLGARALASDTARGLLRRSGDGRIDAAKLSFEARSEKEPSISVSPRPQRKLDLMVSALETTEGATIAELAAITSWQEKSVRAALSTQIPRRLGLQIEAVRTIGSAARYRLQRPSARR